ncbi:MAG: type I restriction endonuclease subunit R, partial [Planctomycetota bacterium]|nr:type I restriction endonuclease subunit R [Planctomycetota bacterium]
KLAIDKYIRDKRYAIGTLVAFSGEVDDRESAPDSLSEASKLLNPTLNGRDIREAFKGDDYRILLVANKFQTGFDQPLLCGMYVDKRLAGIQAVQTLSRLNRAHPGKDTTYVLDFVNDPDEVLASFQTYYETAELSGTTDPNLVFDLRSKLDAAGHYDDNEVERVVRVELDPKARQGELVAALEPVFDRLMRRYKEARESLTLARKRADKAAETVAQEELEALVLFRSDMGSYVRLYTFLSQIFDYGQTALEKRAIFYKRLIPLLEFERERSTIDLSKVQLTHHALRDKRTAHLGLVSNAGVLIDPLQDAGAGAVQEKQKAYLAELIERVNELFSGDLTDNDKLVYVQSVLRTKLLESPTLQQQAANNSKEQFAASPDLSKGLVDAIMESYDAHTAMSSQALASKPVQDGLLRLLLDYAGLYEALKARGTESIPE